jgi:MEDS: MEthanogen/methylotroph, DcmR Sensory domain
VAIDSHAVRFAGGTLGRHRHICAFFNGADEERRVLRSFIKDGFARGEKAFHLVDPELRIEHLRGLADAGIDVQQMMDIGQLEVLPWGEAYLRGDRFDQNAMLALIEEVLQSGAGNGYPLTRLLAPIGLGPARQDDEIRPWGWPPGFQCIRRAHRVRRDARGRDRTPAR